MYVFHIHIFNVCKMKNCHNGEKKKKTSVHIHKTVYLNIVHCHPPCCSICLDKNTYNFLLFSSLSRVNFWCHYNLIRCDAELCWEKKWKKKKKVRGMGNVKCVFFVLDSCVLEMIFCWKICRQYIVTVCGSGNIVFRICLLLQMQMSVLVLLLFTFQAKIGIWH